MELRILLPVPSFTIGSKLAAKKIRKTKIQLLSGNIKQIRDL